MNAAQPLGIAPRGQIRGCKGWMSVFGPMTSAQMANFLQLARPYPRPRLGAELLVVALDWVKRPASFVLLWIALMNLLFQVICSTLMSDTQMSHKN